MLHQTIEKLHALKLSAMADGLLAQSRLRWTLVLRQVAMRGSCSYKRLRNRSSQ